MAAPKNYLLWPICQQRSFACPSIGTPYAQVCIREDQAQVVIPVESLGNLVRPFRLCARHRRWSASNLYIWCQLANSVMTHWGRSAPFATWARPQM